MARRLGRAVAWTQTRSENLVDSGHSTASALTEGYQLAFLIGVGLVGVAIVVALTVLRTDGGRQEEPAVEPAYSEAG